MNAVQQYSDFSIPFTLTDGDTDYTSANCDDVCIQVGDKRQYWSKGELTWITGENAWMYRLTKGQTEHMKESSLAWQAFVKIGTEIIPFPVGYMEVFPSLGGEPPWE